MNILNRYTDLLGLFLFSILIVSCSTSTAVNPSNSDLASRGSNHSDQYQEYFSETNDDYTRKFRDFSDMLINVQSEIENIEVRISALKERMKTVDKSNKSQFQQNLQIAQSEKKVLKTKLEKIEKGLKLLRKHNSDPLTEKYLVLTKVETLENEISEKKNKSASLITQETEEKSKQKAEQKVSDARQTSNDPVCNLEFNGIDQSTKKEKKEVKKEFLFGYTHPKLRAHFKDNHFLNCDVKTVKLGKNHYLYLFITIASKDAKRNYGFVEHKSTLKFELINGESLYIPNAQNALGQLESYTGYTKYELILPLDKSQYRELRKYELDKIGIMWTSGYEEYEIYNVDRIMNQITCINNN